MGLMPAGAANPFAKLDKQSVIGTLKASGSRDPDVLHFWSRRGGTPTARRPVLPTQEPRLWRRP